MLVAKGWVPISPWWWATIERAYRSKKRNIVGRGGRRGGKSSTIIGRVAVAEMLSGKHTVPPGDVGYFLVLSADKGQAKNRIKTAAKALDDLGVANKATTEEIHLTDKPIGMKAVAATLQAVVSDTCIGALADEMARWKDKDTGANPAREVLSSLRPSMATMPNAIGWYVSAPWSTLDLHHEMVEAGSDETQEVFSGATWEMNPTLSLEATRLLERDELSWQREYAAIPMSSDETKFFAAPFVDAACTPHAWGAAEATVAGGDFAFRRNSSTMVAIDKYNGEMRVSVTAERIPGAHPLKPSQTITELVNIAISHGAEAMAVDLHYIESVREVTEAFEMPLLEFPSDSDSIAQAYVRTRVLLADGKLDLSRAPTKLRDQLKETTAQPTVTGLSIKNPVKDGAHGDLVSALVCAIWAAEHASGGSVQMTGNRRFAREEMSESSDLTDLPPSAWLD